MTVTHLYSIASTLVADDHTMYESKHEEDGIALLSQNILCSASENLDTEA